VSKKHSALFPLAHGYQYQNGTQHRKCMVSSHDLCSVHGPWQQPAMVNKKRSVCRYGTVSVVENATGTVRIVFPAQPEWDTVIFGKLATEN